MRSSSMKHRVPNDTNKTFCSFRSLVCSKNLVLYDCTLAYKMLILVSIEQLLAFKRSKDLCCCYTTMLMCVYIYVHVLSYWLTFVFLKRVCHDLSLLCLSVKKNHFSQMQHCIYNICYVKTFLNYVFDIIL